MCKFKAKFEMRGSFLVWNRDTGMWQAQYERGWNKIYTLGKQIKMGNQGLDT